MKKNYDSYILKLKTEEQNKNYLFIFLFIHHHFIYRNVNIIFVMCMAYESVDHANQTESNKSRKRCLTP